MEDKEQTPELSLVIPCYNEEKTLRDCVRRCLQLKEHGVSLELIIVNDCSADNSAAIADELAREYREVTVFHQPVNMGKGAALRVGFLRARGSYVGIQDADAEYTPLDYIRLLKPMRENKADVVFGSRYLRQDVRRVLYFWHTWMNRSLTFVSNMFTNLDISDMETCYKLFRREVIQELAPMLRENRFGFEPEVTCLVARMKCRVYECAIHYEPRTYEEGKKIGWKDGVKALYCILHYGAPFAPLPMQLLIYFFIGAVCAMANVLSFAVFFSAGLSLLPAVVLAFAISAMLNYFLCIAILFQHEGRWKSHVEVGAYALCVLLMCIIDYGVTEGLIHLGVTEIWSKTWGAMVGFFGNFYLRKYIVF